ncbi:MAG: hypothetical protein RLZZ175_2394 [Bacteroidota bacterium]|jgi:dCMP deaminase
MFNFKNVLKVKTNNIMTNRDTINLGEIYELRKSFTIIGLTGRIGSGCSDIAGLLSKGFDKNVYPTPIEIPKHNTDRKYKIIYNYASENFRGFYLIEYKHIISLFIFNTDFEIFKDFLSKYDNEYQNKIEVFKSTFNNLHLKLSKFNFEMPSKIVGTDLNDLYTIFNSAEFKNASNSIHEIFSSVSPQIRIQILQDISNNLRNGGCLSCNSSSGKVTVYNIVTLINRIIKEHKRLNPDNCKVVIESLRNPLEIMFLKERYSAFYMMAVNSDEDDMNRRLNLRYNNNQGLVDEIKKIDRIEYKGGSDTEFYKQNVSECIQKSDIHISNITAEQASDFNSEKNNLKFNTSPKFSVQQQLLKFLSLIEQPGIITPSPEERSMQIAYTAKYNSGCISRQVGAVVTDENYSIKAVGWNNTPEGHVPCLLRSADDLLNNKDIEAFSDYEKKDIVFHKKFKVEYDKIDRQHLKGRNVSFCFKCIQNSIKEGKNQVHTRSLHAEESAFLQISKYGGQGIKGGKLFTTASPCELCAKKAYQLGIEVIYYIDLYPGISTTHILKAGANKKELRSFHGAIGNAYHKLYSPFIAYKDELTLLTGVDFVDYASDLKSQNQKLEDENQKLISEIKRLKEETQ